jgi:hypothetical protein
MAYTASLNVCLLATEFSRLYVEIDFFDNPSESVAFEQAYYFFVFEVGIQGSASNSFNEITIA